ncbi:hypothetical protein LLWA12L8_FAMOGCFE_00669 [Lactococcus lactis]
METPKIYVVNLNSYNNGRTRGSGMNYLLIFQELNQTYF